MSMPLQKPGRSKQNYATPRVFLEAVKAKLAIPRFSFDFAADARNTVARDFWGIRDDSLAKSGEQWAAQCQGGAWGWLNPPFAHIRPWARRCRETADADGSVAFLVPAGIGSNWFRDFVHD